MKQDELKNKTLEDKIKLLQEMDRMYVMGYVDRALKEFCEKNKNIAKFSI